jgi:putative membrane protein
MLFLNHCNCVLWLWHKNLNIEQNSAMNLLFRIIITAIAAYIAAKLLPGVTVADAKTAILVALVLALLNTFLKPLLIALTIPITILTLGLFLLVINILIVLLAARIVPGFEVHGWITALLFSLIVSLITYLLETVL